MNTYHKKGKIYSLCKQYLYLKTATKSTKFLNTKDIIIHIYQHNEGDTYMSFCTSASSNLRPISLFVAESVFCAFVTACLFAGIPTNLSPSAVNATTDGVVLEPSEFSITLGVFPSIYATHELVVPKSMPMTAPLTASDLNKKISRMRMSERT